MRMGQAARVVAALLFAACFACASGRAQDVGVAANAEEAKDAILFLNPDLCLIDVCLKSYTSGFDMAEYVIEKLGIPVVVMSSDDHPTLPIPFVLKPICLPHLFAMINRALETPRF